MFGKGTRRSGHVKIHGQMKGPRRIPKGFSVGVFFYGYFQEVKSSLAMVRPGFF